MFELRDYQIECLSEIHAHFKKGCVAPLIQLPTGSGKTVILWHLLKELRCKSIIVAPTKELCEQLLETGQNILGPRHVYWKQKAFWPSYADHMIMTNQGGTWALKNGKLEDFDPDILIVDEAHRSCADNLSKLVEWFIDNGKRVCGLTATPERMDGKSLLDLYDGLAYSRTLLDLIDEGHLVDMECYTVRTNINLGGVVSTNGDIPTKILKKLDTESRNRLVLNIFQKECAKLKTIVFSLNVEHAETLAALFRQNDIVAESIHGGMSKKDRASILGRFRSGTTQVLCNCQLLTEGFDEPSIEAVLLARPTRSKALFSQMIGRGVRPFPGKSACKIIHFGDSIPNLVNWNVAGSIDNNRFEFGQGERFSEGIKRFHKETAERLLSLEEITYSVERASINVTPFSEVLAYDHQLEKLDQYGIFYLPEITAYQAAYLLFKTRMLEKHGFSPQDYWKKWKRVLACPCESSQQGSPSENV